MQQAFSLIELLLVLVLLGLLAGVAMPVYQQSVLKARRADARITLYDYSQRLYRCTLSTDKLIKCRNITVVPAESLHGFYKIRISHLSNHGFELTASPTGSQARDQACAEFILHSNQRRSISGYADLRQCW